MIIMMTLAGRVEGMNKEFMVCDLPMPPEICSRVKKLTREQIPVEVVANQHPERVCRQAAIKFPGALLCPMGHADITM